MDYQLAKHLHMGLAYLTFCFFIVRFLLFKLRPKFKQVKLLKILPHIIDTSLLAMAIYLCWLLKIYPLQQDWLTAKVIALVAYVVFGVFAIRQQKNWAMMAAMACFIYMLGVAKAHNVMSWLIFI